jgi:hypothetical protein
MGTPLVTDEAAGGRPLTRAGLGTLGWADALIADVLFLCFLLVVAAVRWQVFRALALPSGADGGNWLALGRALGHLGTMPGGVVYPPLVPALALVVDVLGKPIAGVKLIATVASVTPAAGCYVAARICGMRWTALLPCAFLALTGSVGEAAAWGGYPQLFGLGFLPLAIALLDRALRAWRPGIAALGGLALAATLASSELIGAVAVVAAALLVVIHLLVLGSRPSTVRSLLIVAGLIVAPSLLLVPVYLQLLTAVWATRGVKPARGNIAVRDILSFVYRDFPVLWFPMQALAVATPAVLWFRTRRPICLLAMVVTISTAVLLLGLRQIRFGYVAPESAVLGLAASFEVLGAVRSQARGALTAIAATALLPLLVYQYTASAQLFRGQVSFYQVIPGDWVPTLAYLRDQTPAGSLVAVGPDGQDRPTGWWVQGLGRRPALISSDPAWLNFPGERARANEARWIFDPSLSAGESVRRARSLGVAYLLVDKRWSHYTAWYQGGAGLQVVVDSADVALVDVGAAG